jgi:hypothetical protein
MWTTYILTILLAIISIPAGYIISKFVPEELPIGKPWFIGAAAVFFVVLVTQGILAGVTIVFWQIAAILGVLLGTLARIYSVKFI